MGAMRILQVSSARNLGGGETHVIQLVEKLRERGHSDDDAGRPGRHLHAGIELPFLNSADFLSALRLRKILKAERIDVVHAHVARDYTVVAAAAWGVADVKVVFTRHLLYPVKKHVLYRRVDGWLAPTSQILRTLGHLKPKRTAVVPNWVNLSRFEFRPHDLHTPVSLGLLGQISPHKGHDDAIEAMRLLGDGYQLLIAGEGKAEYVDTLTQKARGLPVTFSGFVEPPEFFDTIDVLLVPSWEEPFGIVLLEAMASGIPVISTAAGGPLDIIRTGVDGILVPPRNPQALAAAVHAIDFQRAGLVGAARQRVESDFD